ncbi:MAG: peptidase M28 family protein, partial [Crocinitomicaceae bacterium]
MFRIIFISLICLSVQAQNDSIFIQQIYNTALSKGESYENLRSLCKDIGNRLSGSAGAKMAVDWSKQKMESYHFDKVYLQPIMVPHWERGTPEKGWIRTEKGEIIKVHLLALGGSIGTSGLMEAEIIEFKTLKALMNANASLVKDKIVFINEPMNEDLVNTLQAYGNAYPVRGNGASESAKLGAKAVIIRSLGLPIDIYPHTGTMHYKDSVQKIPAAAIST